ncbi:23S rRNA pseudouridine1911/1915/1917 synthase [Clostridium amylolyticum]|uniref:Pseudouridine synthase n=1 Tax=Clostridium amylolyticum TaxID=1121298 RepID=A0A1M6KJE1_9CLOT|nr:RluA family pseudouridine synthase [Clostridium amylolyticum]SHJ59093.1 23S rRNA pseudouridine1911/1915/1917 synthase [Clostridium amylolyticum]
MDIKKYTVQLEYSGERIDKYLASMLQDSSRSFIQNLINKDLVRVNSKKVKSNYKLKASDEVEISIPEPEKLQVVPQDIPIKILYEDSDVVVVDKPQGMVVHPAAGNKDETLVNALLFHCHDLSGINGVMRPGIVHRIDKDTSGVLVIAKNDKSHNILAEQFKNHTMNREYLALVEGRLKNEMGTIDANLGRNPKDRLKYAVVKDGKRAVTHYKVMECFSGYTLVLCKLETGRTHQIRVHMASIGHPLVGDPLYGFKKQNFKTKGQLLHARLLGFIHPTKNEYMEFTSPLPEDFTAVLNKLRQS